MNLAARGFLLACVLSATAVLAGCGGGEARLSAKEFNAQANALCAQYLRELSFVPQPEVFEDLSPYANLVEPRAQRLADGLRALNPPESVQPAFARFVGVADSSVRSLQALGQASRAGKRERVATIQSNAEKTQEQWYRLAGELGLRSCSGAPG